MTQPLLFCRMVNLGSRPWILPLEPMLMLFMLTGCSSEGPTALLTTDTGVVAPIEMDKPAIPSAESWGTELSLPSTPVSNLRGDDDMCGGSSMTQCTWKTAHLLERAVQEFARDNDGIYPGLLDFPPD